MQEIVLKPLGHEDLGRLIGDALHCTPAYAAPLARLMHDKTAGNPFFAIQFLTALAEEGLVAFDHGQARWSWNIDRIHAKGYTDNVVDFLLGKLRRLPEEAQHALQQLACLGNIGDIATHGLVQAGERRNAGRSPIGGGARRVGFTEGWGLSLPARPRTGGGLCAHP